MNLTAPQEWTLRPAYDAERAVTFSMRCTASDPDEDFEPMHTWSLRHVARNPDHTGFREIIHRRWRAVATE
ncbi:hypothetical protein I5Q34_04970 [Streptomyces sp. AV19]|uniref:DUF7848 domain-containing protein n=1 Tax=Streptomyces sp. AV19 TaxID=2793068 RepID=UPI0018FE237E|nr:hypothetical protein [Streptomyces sp. AV19]MBH1933651.1 hypothetical protein [Streptomyces sp. AV19]MDG4535842.1 hypothetical protein [Streptomyces sp. AV19]